MKRSWISNLVIAVVIGLLTLFLGLQYTWLYKAGEAERERMQKRVETDTKNFADEFNREMQSAYFNFQTDASTWKNSNYTEFNERYDYWKSKTEYPEIIRELVFFATDSEFRPLRYNPTTREFEPTAASDDTAKIRDNVANEKNFRPVIDSSNALIMPIYEGGHRVERILIDSTLASKRPIIKSPDRYGYLVIFLDRSVIFDKLLPALASKYFPDGEYNIAVANKSKEPIFGANRVAGEPDAKAALLDLTPDNFIFFANRDIMPKDVGEQRSGIVVNQRLESHSLTRTETLDGKTDTLKIVRGTVEPGKPRTSVVTSTTAGGEPWTLNIYHSAGSIDAFISGERNRNFLIGLGLYLLLVGSIMAILLSAMRSKLFAQRQIDFVSSVSHEFRTPLAVIYSAGENLADGVTKDREQILRYGQLIKGEGKKLSGMVEQILEFAGARSGRKKYNFTETNVAEVLKNALAECSPVLEEKEFEVETEIADDLPTLYADPDALSTAIQNLLQNAVKYSNGNRWLRLSAENGNGRVKISVEDHGIGISGDDLRQIFEAFYRSKDVVDAQIHGNGLGLSLVKEIAESHCGNVLAESEIGKGSKFTIELPKTKN